MGLYRALELPLPPKTATKSFPILIYGGSTATGSLAIQFSKLSGCQVLTTCSPSNFEYVTKLGADKVFDYNSPTCVQDIKSFTNNSLAYVFDCIAERESPQICLKAMGDNVAGHYACIGPVPEEAVKAMNPNFKYSFIMGQIAFGEPLMMRERRMEPDPAAFEFAKVFWDLTAQLLEDGKIKPHTPSVNEEGKGLEGVLIGLQLLRERKVSAKKLVYTI